MTVATPSRRPCSLLSQIVIEPGTHADYAMLAQYHYRAGRPGGIRAIYRARCGRETVGVIVYAAPALMLRIRDHVLGREFRPEGQSTRKLSARAINQKIETISRVIVSPTYRGIGLGVRLVAETLRARPVDIIESSAVMGAVNPYFKRAGMEEHVASPSWYTTRILAAIRAAGISERTIASTSEMRRRIAALAPAARRVLERELREYDKRWLKGRTRSRSVPTVEGGLRRAASNCLLQPRYYLWLRSGPATTSAPEPVPRPPARTAGPPGEKARPAGRRRTPADRTKGSAGSEAALCPAPSAT